jgi:hypothetical protein
MFFLETVANDAFQVMVNFMIMEVDTDKRVTWMDVSTA